MTDYVERQRAAGRADEEIRAELLALADAAAVFAPNAEEPVTGPTEGPAVAAGPTLRREGIDLVLTWPYPGPCFELRTIHDKSDGVHGELTVFQNGRRLLWGGIPLASVSSRGTWRKQLDASAPDVVWRDLLEEAAYRFTQAAREGEPGVTLTGVAAPTSRELLPGVLYESEVTVLAGDGDSGKSMMAMAIAVAMETGTPLTGRLKPARRVHVAILDWETDRATADMRMGQLAAGLGVDPPPIYYRRMVGPLYERARPLAADLARQGVGLVIIDSQQFAIANGDGAAFHEGAIQFFVALRLFAPAPVLVVNHVTNADARNGSAGRPFGGAFSFNGPRLVWTALRDRNIDGATAITFINLKANNLPRRPDPFGLRFQPGDDTITCYPFNLAEAAPQTTAGASLPFRISLAVADGPKTVAELAETLKADEDTIGRTLRRKKGKTFETVGDDKPQRWGLVSR